jgi:alcohol dehydrogenase
MSDKIKRMKALVFDESLALKNDIPQPRIKPGWAKMQVIEAGICRTDLELIKGYMGYKGILGHEFVGRVVECENASWLNIRVTGEINAACGTCKWCQKGLGRHCPNRTVLGIQGLDGCMAEYCLLPVANLLSVPDSLSDDQAVFIEPLSAAYEILEQVKVRKQDRCVVLGDGKLGILCAWVLCTVCDDVTLAGHHAENLQKAAWQHLKTTAGAAGIAPGADLVVEATGSVSGLTTAINLCRPRGTLVLKSTLADGAALNLAPVVVNELTVVGSRCGLFQAGLQGMTAHLFPVERLIAARYPLEKAEEAFIAAAQHGTLKVILDIN